MKDYPFTNRNDHAVHIGGKMIPPGETRMVDASMLHDAHSTVEAESAIDEPQPSLLDGTVKDVLDALPGLSDEEMEMLGDEEEAGAARKGVLEGIAHEFLCRASESDETSA